LFVSGAGRTVGLPGSAVSSRRQGLHGW